MSIQLNKIDLFGTIFRVYHVAVLIYNSAGTVLERFSPNPESDELLLNVSNCKEQLFQLCDRSRLPQIITNEINQIWAGVPLFEEENLDRLIVLGPVHTSDFSKNQAVDYIRSYHFSTQQKDDLLAALEQTPVCPYVELTKILSLIYTLIYGDELDISLLAISGLVKEELVFADELHEYQERLANTEDTFHLTYDFEQYLLGCIREGKPERLSDFLKTATFNHVEYIGRNVTIRQRKNRFIIMATLAIRAAIEGGLNSQVAYSLRDLYIQRVEILQTLPSILRLYRELLHETTTRVSNLRCTDSYSKVIIDCCDFIDEHVREKLLVTDVAVSVGLHANYIAKKFKEETGQSIKDYIRDAKISEAKSLLKYSKLSLSEISELLSFSSQSFFTYTFRQTTGVTPGQYRQNAEDRM